MRDGLQLEEIAAEFAPEQNVVPGKWFGVPCLKVEGKVFAVRGEGGMAFKLAGEGHAAALQVAGAGLFDLRGKGQPMKNWVLIPGSQSSHWGRFARLACEQVAGAAQAAKEEIISGLAENRRKIMDLAATFSAVDQEEVFLGIWSVKDLIAHLIGWDYTNLEAGADILLDRKPAFWEFYDRDWQTYNARLVKKYRRENFAELMASANASHQQLLEYLETLPADTFVQKRKILTLLRAEIKDEAVHYEQVAAFKQRHAAQ